MQKLIEISNFDQESNRIDFRYLGDSPVEFNVRISWRGTTVYWTSFKIGPDPNCFYFISCMDNPEFDVLEAEFLSLNWDEKFIFEKTDSRNSKFLPQIFSHPKDSSSYWTFKEIFVDKIYENEFIDIEKGDIVVDIGANYGFFSIFAKNKGAYKVYSYEPSRIVFEYLKKNSSIFDGIEIFKCAISKSNGSLIFEDDYQGSAGSRIVETPNSKTYEVPVISLEQIFLDNQLNRIDYLKIDCEGEEANVLSSIDLSHFKKIRKIFIECHNQENEDKVSEILSSQGFEFLVEKNDTIEGFSIIRAKNLNPYPKKKLALIGSYCNTKEKKDILLENINIIKSLGIDILLLSPLELEREIVSSVDYYFETKENPLLFWPERAYTHWFEKMDHEGKILTLHRGLPDYGWAGLFQIKKLSEIALTHDYDIFYHLIYDVELDSFLIENLNNDEVNYLHPRRNPKNPSEMWDASLHFMCFDRDTMEKISNEIRREKYSSELGMAETQASGWISKFNLLTCIHPVKDKIFYWEDFDFFNYSKNPSYRIFWSKNEDIDQEVKLVLMDFDLESKIEIYLNEIKILQKIEPYSIIQTGFDVSDIKTLKVVFNGHEIDYSNEFFETMRNVVYYRLS